MEKNIEDKEDVLDAKNEKSEKKVSILGGTNDKPKKKKGKWILLGIFLLFISLILWFVGSMFWFAPKNLGVKYTMEDYYSALEKTGISISFAGVSGEDLEQLKSEGIKRSINDYNWEFKDYEAVSFTLTNEEATALLNEIAPGFWWFDRLQVKVAPDGTMEGSSRADIDGLKRDLYNDVAADIPIFLPSSVNIYSKGVIEIKNNSLSGNPESFYVGAAPLPQNLMTSESISVMEEYFPRIYTVVPGLEINSLTSEDGQFKFDGVIPQTIIVEPK